jgi:3-oxoadipate enol-lactonase
MTQGHVLIAGGTSLSFDVVGAGPDVVLLHAGIADSRMWAGTVDALSDSYRVITYDQRGFGRSQPAPIAPFHPMDDVVAILDHLAVDRFSVIGCSMGGTLAVDLAVQYPNRVQALVPVAAGVSGLPESNDALEPKYEQLGEAMTSGDLERFGQIALDIWAPVTANDPSDDRIRAQLLENRAGMIAWFTLAQSGSPAYPHLGDITAPTLVVVGEQDSADCLRACHTIATQVLGAQIETLPGLDHNVPERAGNQFTNLLRQFLDTVLRSDSDQTGTSLLP